MKGLFWNRTEARLRAGWRVVLFVVASGVASMRCLVLVVASWEGCSLLYMPTSSRLSFSCCLSGSCCGWPPDGSTTARSLTMAFT
jgi:hypothetical protein